MNAFRLLFSFRYILLGIALIMTPVLGVRYGTMTTHVATVSGAENICRNNACKYLVYTENGTFENRDDLLALKFNSSDLHGRMLRGGEYEIVTTGVRFGPFSWYPNVLRVTPITASDD
jgi:hypothetical protein